MPYIEDNNKTTYDRLYRAARGAKKRLDIMVADKYDPSWIKDAEQQRDDAVKALGDFVRISGMEDYLTPAEVEELRKDKQAITAQSNKLWETFKQQQQQEEQPDIESIYEALQ